MKKNILLFIIFFLNIFFVSTQKIHAGYVSEGFDTGRMKADTDNLLNSEGSTAKHINDSFKEILLHAGGCFNGITCPSDAPTSYKQKINGSSLASYSNNLFVAMYINPPASTGLAVRDLGKTFGLLPDYAYAQTPGIGFAGLSPILPIWKVFRNISYFLLAVVMVVIGFMVMFRKKIDPKTVVTVQNAIPGIVVTMLLITFSYAIVGILVDLMYLLSVLVVSMLVPAAKSISAASGINWYPPEDYPKLLSGSWWDLGASIFGVGMNTIDDVYNAVFGGFLDANMLGGSAGLAAGGGGIGGIIGLFLGGASLGAAGAAALTGALVGGLLPILIIVFITLFLFFRILFMTVGAYISIILALITAPLQLLPGALPGNNAFVNWFSGLVSNLLVFPTTIALILISAMLATAGQDGTLWTPPMVVMHGLGIQGIIALGVLATIPNIVNSMKEAFKAKAPVSPSLGTIFGPTANTAGMAMQLGYQALFIKQAAHNQDTGQNVQERTQGLLSGQKPGKGSGGHG